MAAASGETLRIAPGGLWFQHARTGLDLNPLDITCDDDVRWLSWWAARRPVRCDDGSG
jgi:hypothetical protein